jgi:hypothetical protein
VEGRGVGRAERASASSSSSISCWRRRRRRRDAHAPDGAAIADAGHRAPRIRQRPLARTDARARAPSPSSHTGSLVHPSHLSLERAITTPAPAAKNRFCSFFRSLCRATRAPAPNPCTRDSSISSPSLRARVCRAKAPPARARLRYSAPALPRERERAGRLRAPPPLRRGSLASERRPQHSRTHTMGMSRSMSARLKAIDFYKRLPRCVPTVVFFGRPPCVVRLLAHPTAPQRNATQRNTPTATSPRPPSRARGSPSPPPP